MRLEAEAEQATGLIRAESLEIWAVWYRYGGEERGLTLTEIMNMPPWLRKDFDTIRGRLAKERRRRRALENASTGST